MNATQTPNLTQHQDLSALVAGTQPVLDAEVDLATAQAIWDLATDDRHLVLSIHDAFDGQATATFAPEEFANEAHLRSRLRDVKGAILRVSDWRRKLRGLYVNLRAWLADLQPAPYVEETPITLNEQRSGPYEVSALHISSEGRTMSVEPVASWVVAADGRVELRGSGGPFTLVLQNNEWFWLDPRRTAALQPLTKELFLDLVQASWE